MGFVMGRSDGREREVSAYPYGLDGFPHSILQNGEGRQPLAFATV